MQVPWLLRTNFLSCVLVLLAVVVGDDDSAARHLGDNSRRPGEENLAAVDRDALFHARADQRRLRLEQRDGLPLHVRAEKRSAGVVVFKEGDEGSRYADQLHRRDIHVLDALRGLHSHFIADARLDAHIIRTAAIVDELALLVQRGVRLGYYDFLFLVGGEVNDVTRHVGSHGDTLLGNLRDPGAEPLGHESTGVENRLAVGIDDGLIDCTAHEVGISAENVPVHPAVRRLDEAMIVRPGIRGQGTKQADVRAFRRLDRADAPVVRGVNIPHVESRAVSRKAAGAEGGQATLVRQFRQRVGLVHELRELRPAEELAHRRHHRP